MIPASEPPAPDSGSPKPSCCHAPARSGLSFRNSRKTLAAGLVCAAIPALAVRFEALRPFADHLLDYLKIILPAVVAGLAVGGLIDRFVPHWYIERVMSGTRKRAIARSVLLGFLMSACCHGILAVAVELYRKGASTASVIAFLLASPWANLPLTIILFGFFGAKALFFVGGAMLIALATGWTFQLFEKRGWVERNPNHSGKAHQGSVLSDLRARLAARRWTAVKAAQDAADVSRGALRLADMILWWILVGALAASAVGTFVPEHWMREHLGPTFKGMVFTLAGATVLEVCSEGTAPLAFEIYRQTHAFGNAFVFLLAGVATDYTEIGLIWQNIGRRAAVLLPLIAVPQIFLLGLLANRLF